MEKINVNDFMNLTKEQYMELRGVTANDKENKKWKNIQVRMKYKDRDFLWKDKIMDILVTLEDDLIKSANKNKLSKDDLLSLTSFMDELDFSIKDREWSLYLQSHNFLISGKLIVNLLKEDLELRHIKMEKGQIADIIPHNAIFAKKLLDQEIRILDIPVIHKKKKKKSTCTPIDTKRK